MAGASPATTIYDYKRLSRGIVVAGLAKLPRPCCLTLLFAQIDGAEFAFVAELEGETGPAIGPTGMGGIAVVGEAQTGKAENSSLPDRTTACIVNTLCRVEAQVLQVNQSSCHEEVIGIVDQT